MHGKAEAVGEGKGVCEGKGDVESAWCAVCCVPGPISRAHCHVPPPSPRFSDSAGAAPVAQPRATLITTSSRSEVVLWDVSDRSGAGSAAPSRCMGSAWTDPSGTNPVTAMAVDTRGRLLILVRARVPACMRAH